MANANDWPTRGFWVRNKDVNSGQGDLRYVDYRSANSLYTKPVVWGWVDFKNGSKEIKPGTKIRSSAGTTYTAVVDQVQLTSGSWVGGNATGRLILKDWLVNFSFSTSYNILVNEEIVAVPSATSVRGYRGHAAATWSTSSAVEPASDIDIGIDVPDESGHFRNPENENTAPESIGFVTADSQSENVFAGTVAAGGALGIWVRQTILNGTQARENIEGDIAIEWY